MRKLFLFGTLLVTTSLRGQYSYEQVIQTSSGGSGGSAASATCVFSANVTSGNLLVAAMVWFNTTGPPTVTDTVSTSYAQKATVVDAAQDHLEIWAGTAGGSGANTITVTQGGSGQVVCAEFPPNWSLTTDATTTGTFTSASTVTTSNITTTLNHDLLFAAIGTDVNTGKAGPNGGGYAFCGFHGGWDSLGAMFKLGGIAGTENASFLNDSQPGVVALVAFKSNSLAITSAATLPDGSLNNSYRASLQAAGGVGATTWSITSGVLQSGLTLSGSFILGTPTSSSQNTLTLQVQDAGAVHTATQVVTLKIGATANAIGFLQGAHNTGATKAFSSNVASGSLIYVSIVESSHALIPKCTGTRGETFHPLRSANQQALSPDTVTLLAGATTSAGTETITCSIGDGIKIAEFSNAQEVLDNNDVTFASVAQGADFTSGNLTPTDPNSVLVGECTPYFPLTTSSLSAPFTIIGAREQGGISGYRIVTTVVPYTMTCTASDQGTQTWVNILAGFRPTTGAVSTVIRHKAFVE